MAVEEVDMSVPVVTPAEADPEAGSPETSVVAALAVAAVRDRRRLALTRRARERREREFDSALKRIAKRLAADLASEIPERRLGERLRIRAYGEAVALASVLRDDRRRDSRRVMALLAWVIGLGALALAALLGAGFAAGWLKPS